MYPDGLDVATSMILVSLLKLPVGVGVSSKSRLSIALVAVLSRVLTANPSVRFTVMMEDEPEKYQSHFREYIKRGIEADNIKRGIEAEILA